MSYNDENIKAVILKDSFAPIHEARLTSMLWTYPRIIMAEVNTHRSLSKSSASSRAIPIQKQADKVASNPFQPSWFGATQKGMQSNEELKGLNGISAKAIWRDAADYAVSQALKLDKLGLHKQIANRLLEPFGYVTTLVTGTEWANLFNLRAHPDAQPEFMVLAYRALDAYMKSQPEERDLHLPFEDFADGQYDDETKIKVNVARCARLSYLTHDGSHSVDVDLKLYDSLFAAGHMNPFEHVAKPWTNDQMIGNFKGWVQHRKIITGENRGKLNAEEIMSRKPDWIVL